MGKKLSEITTSLIEKSPRDALNYLFGDLHGDVTGQPDSWHNMHPVPGGGIKTRVRPDSLQDLKEFLVAYKRCVDEEEKRKDKSGRQSALLSIQQAAQNYGQTFQSEALETPAGTIQMFQYLFDLALRVREPKLIHQGSTSWCCFDSILRSYAKREPQKYVEYAIELASRKKGTFEAVEVPCITKSSWGTPDIECREMPAVDYITMGSLVTYFNAQIGRGFPGNKWDAGILPKDVFDLLKKFYKKGSVTLNQHFPNNKWTYSPEKRQWLVDAQKMPVKIIFTSGNFVENLKAKARFTFEDKIDKRKGPTADQTKTEGGFDMTEGAAGKHAHHAVLVDKLIVHGDGEDGKVEIKFNTWGLTLRGEFNMGHFCGTFYAIATATP